MAESLGSAVLTLSVDDAAYKAGLNAAKATAEKQGQAIGRSLGSSIGTAIAGLGVGAALAGFFKQSIQAAIELESITKKLSNTLGEQGAGKALAFTKGLSDELGLSFKTLAGTFGSFTAAASAAGVPLEVQRDLFASVSKAAQQLGLSNDELAGSLLALQQIASKGTVSMEELRGQLGERLPIAFAAAAKGLGVTQQELIKLVESGKLTSTQFFPAITKGLDQLLASSAGAPTAAQNLGTLANAWDALQTSFGTDLLPSVTESVKTLTAVIEGLGRKQRADKLGFGTGGAGFLGQISDQAIDAVENLKQVQQQFNLSDKQANSLFTDAVAGTQKGQFVQNPAFLDADRIALVNQKVRELAQSYREANPDRADELSKESAIIEKLRLASIARADAETRIATARSKASDTVAPSRERLSDLQATFGLEGAALEIVKQKLAIDKERTQEARAIAAYDSALRTSGFNREDPAVIDAAARLEAAANNVNSALVSGLKESAGILNQSVKDLRSAFDSQRTAREGSFDLLTDRLQQGLLTDARQRIRAGIEAGELDPRKVEAAARNPQDILRIAAQADSLVNAQEAVVKANGELKAAIAELSKKDWGVNVQVNADGKYTLQGDVINGALSA